MRHEWRALQEQAECSFFQTWEWVSAWHDTLEPRSELLVISVTNEGGRIVGLLPVAKLGRRLHSRVPVSIKYLGLAGSGRGAGDHLGPLVAVGDALSSLFAELPNLAGRAPILLESVDERWAPIAARSLGAELIDKIRCPAILLPEADDVTARWPKKLRQNVRRRGQQLADLGIGIRWIPPGRELCATLTSLQDLHTRRWQSKGGSGLFDEDRLAFMQRLAEVVEAPHGPWLLLLEHEEDVVAALLGFRHRSALAVYKTGWDPEYKRYGLGIALAFEAMKWMKLQGLTTLDYLRGSEPHKYELGALDRTDVTLVAGSGVGSWLLKQREMAGARRSGPESGRGMTGTSLQD